MNVLYKQNGTKMKINDNSLAYAKSLGWTELDPSIKPEVKVKTKAKAK